MRGRLLERGLIRVRWFGALFAFFQIYMGAEPPCPPGVELRTLTNPVTQYTPGCEPDWVRPEGYALAIGMVVMNLIVAVLLRRVRDEKSLSRLGVGVFLADHLVVIAYTWLYSYTLETNIWVVLYILPLEGALRYGMKGALASLAILTGTETGRDLFRREAWGYPFNFVPDTTFRVGIMTIIGLVTGMMARNLQRERVEVEKKAVEASMLAAGEAAARREVEALHRATIAGISSGDPDEALKRMVTTVGEMFGYESLSMGLLEEHPGGPRLRVAAGYRYPEEAIGRTLSLDQGVSGPVARTGKSALINDVTIHESYLELAPWCRSEMVVALRIGERIIGILNVESEKKDAFTTKDLEILERVSLPLAIVVENARILAKEREAVHRLTELDEMKSDFIAITSHELRTPLTSIMGFLKTLRRQGLDISPKDQEQYLDIVERQSQRLLEIVEDLLFASQIERGSIELRTVSFELGELVHEVIEERFPDDSSKIQFSGTGPITMSTDRDRLRRVIFSLVENALKFSPESGRVTVSFDSIDGAGRLQVRDEGMGIPAEEIDRIFDRFHQVGGSMGRAQTGFGLGLYVSKRIIESLGGTIEVDSEPHKGSTFTVTIPIRDQGSVHSVAS